MRARFLLTIAAASLAASLAGAGAGAAPQALGLVATNAPVPLKCLGDECTAQFSTFCLQSARDIPAPGTAYRPVGDGFTLLAIARDGTTRRLPGTTHLTITTARSMTAVEIGISRRALAALGAARAAVEVGPKVSLVPVPVAGDPAPQSPEELAAATGPLRAAGDRLIDNGGAVADAVRLTSTMINALPERGRVGADVRERLWRETAAQRNVGSEGLARAAEVYGTCRRLVDEGRIFSLRRCLEREHDGMMLRLNLRYWQAIAGS